MSNNNLDNSIQMIINQTNYDEEKAKDKLKECEGDHINVIKEYLNPDFRNKKVDGKKKSVNQQMMSQIRNFMDDISKQHQERKAKGLTKV